MADSLFHLHSLLPQRGPLEGFQKAASDPAAFSAAFIWGIIFFGAAVFLWVASRNRWQVREVARQMNAGLFERSVFNPPKLSTALRELHPQAAEFFKNVYTLEFLGLPAEHAEADLHSGLLRHLGRFLTELGRDFCFIGSQHPSRSADRISRSIPGKKETPAPVCRKRQRKDFRGLRAKTPSTAFSVQA